MQNLSNFSNFQAQRNNTNLASIEHLQKYITQLTLYINQNNHKYNKNMHILKEFYEEQVETIKHQREQVAEENSHLKNQLNISQDILATRNLKIKEIQIELSSAKENAQDSRERLLIQRKKIDELYQQMKDLRDKCNSQIQNAHSKLYQHEQTINNYKLEKTTKESEIQRLNKAVYVLQEQVSERFSLPEKIRQIQHENDQLKMTLNVNKRKLLQIQQKMDYNSSELEKLRKQNESLRISKGKYTAQKSLEIQKAVKQQKQNKQHIIKRLESQNQGYIFQLNESQSRIKIMAKEIQNLQKKIEEMRQLVELSQRQVKVINQSKDGYMNQFGELKVEYEKVIERLEESLINYQKKNWTYEQENKDLNSQLQSLQDLLQQVKAINNLQPSKSQYRKLAEMQIISNKRDPTKNKYEPSQEIKENLVFESDYKSDWQKLLKDIQSIKI